MFKIKTSINLAGNTLEICVLAVRDSFLCFIYLFYLYICFNPDSNKRISLIIFASSVLKRLLQCVTESSLLVQVCIQINIRPAHHIVLQKNCIVFWGQQVFSVI